MTLTTYLNANALACLNSPHPTPAESPSPAGRRYGNRSLLRDLSKARLSDSLLPLGEDGPLGPDEGLGGAHE